VNLPRINPIAHAKIGQPSDHPDWLFELKHDGFRALAYIDGGKCELVSRKRNVYKRFGPARRGTCVRARIYTKAPARELFESFRERQPVAASR
jgi:ATP-dependent DNA ligase